MPESGCGSLAFAAGADASKITGVYGGKGSDTIIGNDIGNVLIGFEGNDTMVGNGGNDELAATRDFSPAIGGTSELAGSEESMNGG